MTPSHAPAFDVRTLDPDQLRPANDLFSGVLLHGPIADEHWGRRAAAYVPGRTLGAYGDGELIGTATSFAVGIAVPGGATLPAAAVTGVGVRPDRTRRGVLTALMRRQLADLAAAGDVLASLRATEARIYGRFGFGVASRGRHLRVARRGGSGWRRGAPTGGSVRLLARQDVLPTLMPLYQRIGLSRPGAMTRFELWWQQALGRLVDDRDFLLAAVHTGPEGDDGFLVGTVDDAGGWHDRRLVVRDLHAAGLPGAAALWRFALGVDLVSGLTARQRPLDEPVELLLEDPRDCEVTGVEDETWLRILDVPAALGARRFRPADPVLLAVRDPLLPANSGVYRIAGDGTERVGDLGAAAEPDLECDVTGLAMAYLGDRRPSELVATGWWTSRCEPAVVARADEAFRPTVVPWSGTNF